MPFTISGSVVRCELPLFAAASFALPITAPAYACFWAGLSCGLAAMAPTACFVACCAFCAMVCEKMATSRATPMVKPTWRMVLSEPEPTPRTCGGRDAMEAADRVGMARPIPTPMNSARQTTSHKVASPLSCASRIRPKAKHPAPAAAGRRGPMRSLRRPELGAISRETSGITDMPTAACSGV